MTNFGGLNKMSKKNPDNRFSFILPILDNRNQMKPT